LSDKIQSEATFSDTLVNFWLEQKMQELRSSFNLGNRPAYPSAKSSGVRQAVSAITFHKIKKGPIFVDGPPMKTAAGGRS